MWLENLSLCVQAVTGTMTTTTVDAERMAEAAESEFSTATGTRDGKFGIDVSHAPAVYAKAAGLPGIAVRGIAVHVGSQLADLDIEFVFEPCHALVGGAGVLATTVLYGRSETSCCTSG